MTTQDPINLSTFRNDAVRTHNRGMERQYRLAVGLVTALCAATVAAFLTLGAPAKSGGAPEMTSARSTSLPLARG